jgi:hypothetical protein
MGKAYLERAEAVELFAPIARQAGSYTLFGAIYEQFVDLGASLGFSKLRPTGRPGYGIACSNGKLILMSLFVKRAGLKNTLVLACNPDAFNDDPRCAQLLRAHQQFGQTRGLLTGNAREKDWVSVRLSSQEIALTWMNALREAVMPAAASEHAGAGGSSGSPRDSADPPEGVDRRGQSGFRRALLRAYENRCAMSACSAVDALEAAHITPVVKDESYFVTSGLLLRADLHTLFDLHLLSVNPETLTIAVSPAVWDAYGEFNDRALALPRDPSAGPETSRLRHHYGLFLQAMHDAQ